MLSIFVRTVIIYFSLVLSIRLTGKRQVGEMQLSELITAFLISEVASAPLSDPDVPLLFGLLPIFLLMCIEILVSYLTTKSTHIKRFFEPPPTVLIANGKLNLHALKKQRLTADEVFSALRLKDISTPTDVAFCFLEHNGQISAFTKDQLLQLPVMIDGKVYRHFLSLLGRDEAWLFKHMREDKRKKEELFLVSTDGTTLFYIEKDG